MFPDLKLADDAAVSGLRLALLAENQGTSDVPPWPSPLFCQKVFSMYTPFIGDLPACYLLFCLEAGAGLPRGNNMRHGQHVGCASQNASAKL